MGTLFIRGPKIGAGKSMTLKWDVETIDLGRARYEVTAYTGPTDISSIADLTAVGPSWGPLTTFMSFC